MRLIGRRSGHCEGVGGVCEEWRRDESGTAEEGWRRRFDVVVRFRGVSSETIVGGRRVERAWKRSVVVAVRERRRTSDFGRERPWKVLTRTLMVSILQMEARVFTVGDYDQRS